jgi:peptidoglycan/LPS O-acetylase OafA/YrhL
VRTAERRRVDPVPTGYRPWLDGLRGIAISLVVLQHLVGTTSVDLGFAGVGLFFALSGYLITSLLLDEYVGRESVSLPRFYLRRAARLLPALFLMVVVCDLLFLALGDRHPVRGSVFALTYSANYVQVLWPASMPGFGPTWTLAVEEHFYIVWPVALLYVMRRWGMHTALRATLGVCFLALLWRAVLAAASVRLPLLEIGSFERSDALLYGCAAALSRRVGWRPARWMLPAGAALVVLIPILSKDNYPSAVIAQALLAVGAAAVVAGLDDHQYTVLRSLLSTRAIVKVGVLSYGIYLWHGPLMRAAKDAGGDGTWWRAAAAVAAIGVAAVSYRFMEAPLRRRARSVGSRPGIGLAVAPAPFPAPSDSS